MGTLPERMYRTLPADVAAVVRAYPPMVVWFAAALAGTAVVFDIFYLVASPGPALAAVYAVPVLAGLIAGLVAAADDLELERRVVVWSALTAVALGITNIVVVAMISAIRRTDPADWAAGGQSVLLAGCTIVAIAVACVVVSNLIDALRIDVRTHWPRRRQPPPSRPAPAVAGPAAGQAAAGKPGAGRKTGSKASTALAEPVALAEYDPYLDDDHSLPTVVPPPRVVDLEEPREVISATEATGHADRRLPRSYRTPQVPPTRRRHRPGRRPGH